MVSTLADIKKTLGLSESVDPTDDFLYIKETVRKLKQRTEVLDEENS